MLEEVKDVLMETIAEFQKSREFEKSLNANSITIVPKKVEQRV